MNKTKFKSFSIAGLSIGLILVILSLLSHFGIRIVINQALNEKEVLRPNSLAYKFWTNPPVKIKRNLYFFECLNPDEVVTGLEKPKLRERGPYAYNEIWEKRDVNFSSNGQTLDYSPVSTLFFDSQNSNGSEDDVLTILNIPAVLVMNELLKTKSTVETKLVNLILKLTGAKIFIRKTVKELVSGYDDNLLKMVRFFRPNIIKTERFSVLNGRNGTAIENLTISTGISNLNTIGKVLAYNGQTSLNFWYSKEANEINGTDGTLFSPFLTRYNRLYLFNPELCRSLHLDYLRDRYVNGIRVYDFHLPENIFYNSTLNPENNGFCDDEKGCLGNGVLDISSCFSFSGVYLSKPHFLDAEDTFTNNIIGLRPDPEKHDFVVSLEPISGVPIGGHIRGQMNLMLSNSNEIILLKNLTSTLIPTLWLDISLQINSTMSNLIYNSIYFLNVSKIFITIFAILGVMTTITSVIMLILLRNRTPSSVNERESLLEHNASS